MRAALAVLRDQLDSVRVGADRLWFDPSVPARTTRRPGALLVPAFDEVTLTYADHGPPRRDPTSPRPRIVNAIGGGTLLLGDEDVAAWRRTVTKDSVVPLVVAALLPLAAVAATQLPVRQILGALKGLLLV